MEDKQIVELFWQRDPEAIAQSQGKYHSYLSKIAYNVLSDEEDSQEVVNDTYFRAWNSIPPQRPSRLSVYLGRLTRHGAIDRYRKRTSQKRQGDAYTLCLEELEACCGTAHDPQQILDAQQLAQAINQFLHTLKPQTRAMFLGRYYFFDSLKEVARYCGVSESKAKSTLYRVRKDLKEYLKQEGFDL
ncbi:RNA polymerase sigma factor [Pseudoflavonifractor sp. An85]|uniref:RNA polymerase sigma factor n=1 Tax=Pseudoflavonifractor sp. An85 TaxID=1965661 RepID=UPI0013023B50|nr:RNA polymerase sigma factor [Pseudoflavonifractor sp. An85]